MAIIKMEKRKKVKWSFDYLMKLPKPKPEYAGRNLALCKLCGDIIESKSRHDFVSCKCEEIAVDGGNDYRRMIFNNMENFLLYDKKTNKWKALNKYKSLK